jgi:tetratricopeptide (TPR) repeat protein
MLHWPLPGLASADSEYKAGLQSYKDKDYKAATAHFDDAIKQGKKTAAVWLYSGYAFSALGQYQRALKSYEVVTTSFKGSGEATVAAQAIANIKTNLAGAAGNTKGAATAAVAATGLAARINVIPPRFNHQPVSQASVNACREAVAALPKHVRKLLDDDTSASVTISPNLIDRWPESVKDLPEQDPAPTLAELPGRIYNHDMCVYERAKVRGSTNLKEARPPRYIKHQVLNMCFQVWDDLKTISKDPALRKEWEYDKEHVPDSQATRLATFMKTDDWGPRETCSELTGAMLGGGDENTDLLYRYFPRTKKWLAAKLGI